MPVNAEELSSAVQPAASTSAPWDSDGDGDPDRSDAASATAAAAGLGARVEDLSQRNETTQVFAEPDGTWTSESASEPVRAQDDSGEWADIDLTLVQVPGGYAPANAASDLTISSGGDTTFAELNVKGRQLGWTWSETLPEPIIDGITATYPDVVDGGDLVVTATVSGFRHDIRLREAPSGPVSYGISVVT